MNDEPLSVPPADRSAAAHGLQPAARDPVLYMPSINGHAFTSVRFAPTQYGERASYDLTFRMGREPIGRLNGLDATELTAALGPRNLAEMRRQEERGTLRGDQLHVVQGVAPLEKWQELLAPSYAREVNAVTQDDAVLSKEDAAILEQVPALRRRVREAFDQERERLDLQGRVSTDLPRETAVSEMPGRSPAEGPDDIAPAPEYQTALMRAVHAQYKVEDGKFLYKQPPNSLAFEDKGARLVAGTNDERVAQAMVTLAEAKGWGRLKVAGHPDFRREVWLQASLRGLQVNGFYPTQRDRQALAQRQAQTLGNRIEPAVRTETPARTGARQVHRRSEAAGRTGQQQVIEAVASAVIDARVAAPAQRAVLKAAIDARLHDRAQQGRLPVVGVYDRQAPAQRERTHQPQRTEPAVERSR